MGDRLSSTLLAAGALLTSALLGVAGTDPLLRLAFLPLPMATGLGSLGPLPREPEREPCRG